MTVHFYSSKAYRYVRKKFNNNLLNPSIVRAWYRVLDGSPGFTFEALKATKLPAKKKTVVVNLLLHEMSIHEQLIYNEWHFYSCVDFGNNHDYQNDNATHAISALVADSLNDNWKVPIACFLIRSLDSQELNKIDCKVYLSTNLIYSPSFQPYFKNPFTNETCFIFYNLCHIVKFVRNTLGDLKVLQTADREKIA